MHQQTESMPIDPLLLAAEPAPPPSSQSSSLPICSFTPMSIASNRRASSQSGSDLGSFVSEEQDLMRMKIQFLESAIEEQKREVDYLHSALEQQGTLLKKLANQQGVDVARDLEAIREQARKKSRMSDERILTNSKHKELTKAQKGVRAELLLKELSGTDQKSIIPPDKSPGEHTGDDGLLILVPDFSKDVTYAVNDRLISQAAITVYLHHADAIRRDLRYQGVAFTEKDVLEIAKAAFRNWREQYKKQTTADLNDKIKAEKKRAARIQRRRQKKQDRLGARNEYNAKYGGNIEEVLDTDWMSDNVSEPDDVPDRSFHRGRMVSEAGIKGTGQDETIWEIIRPAFRSKEINAIYSFLDESNEEREAASGKKKASTKRVDLGRTHNRIPVKAPYPFMVDEGWKQKHIDGKIVDPPFRTRREDPEGFGSKKKVSGPLEDKREGDTA